MSKPVTIDKIGRVIQNFTLVEKHTRQDGKEISTLVCTCGTKKMVTRETLYMRRDLTCKCGLVATGSGKSGGELNLYLRYVRYKNMYHNPNSNWYIGDLYPNMRMCPEWEASYTAFRRDVLRENKELPHECAMIQKDKNKPLGPGNCLFRERRSNPGTRVPRLYCIFQGKKKTVNSICTEYGMNDDLIRRLYRRGKIPDMDAFVKVFLRTQSVAKAMEVFDGMDSKER